MEKPYNAEELKEFFCCPDDILEIMLEILNDPEIPEPDLIDGCPIFNHSYVWYEIYDDEYGRDEYERSAGESIMAVWKDFGLLIEFVFEGSGEDIRIYRFEPTEDFSISDNDDAYGYECWLRGPFVPIANFDYDNYYGALITVRAFFQFNQFQTNLAKSKERAEKFRRVRIRYSTLRKLKKSSQFDYAEFNKKYDEIIKQAESANDYLNWCLKNYSRGINPELDEESIQTVRQACEKLENLYKNPPSRYYEEYDNDEREEWRDDKYYPDWLGGMESEQDFWEH